MLHRTLHAETPLQALVLGQALALARQLEDAAAGAPDGQALARVEAAAVPAGRELTRKAVEAALQAQADGAEKKGAPGRRCPGRGKCRRPEGHAGRNDLTAAGAVRGGRGGWSGWRPCARCRGASSGTSTGPRRPDEPPEAITAPEPARRRGFSWSRAAAALTRTGSVSVAARPFAGVTHGTV